MKVKKTRDQLIFNTVSYTFLTLLTLYCFIPFWLIISASFTQNESILIKGYSMFPRVLSIEAYKYLFASPEKIISAYGVSTIVTVVGTTIGLTLITMAGYVLNRKDFKYRNQLSFFIYFTTLFSGGMVPFYILMVSVLKLQNNLLALIFPGMMTPFLIILMRNFMKSIPDALIESAKIDGAGDFRIFRSIVLYLAGPGIATVGLFLALQYWNNWFNAMLFINKQKLYPLQYFLYDMLMGQSAVQSTGADVGGAEIFPGESIKMAMVIVATGPIILVYPYVQKYFVQGLTIGAVKG